MDSEPTSDDESKPLHKNIKRIILITLLSLVALGVLIYATMHFTSQPKFCSSCHEISQPVARWSVAPHKTVTCLECHANPGTVGYVSRKFKGLGEVYLHFTHQIPEPLVAKYNIQTCIVCHTAQKPSYPDAKNIKLPVGDPLAPKFSHTGILQDSISCLVCHRYVGHGEPEPPK